MENALEKKNSLFCKIFNDLITDLVRLYPDDTRLRIGQVAASGMILVDKNAFVSLMIDCLEPYYSEILDKNESFFVNLNMNCTGYYSFINDDFGKIKSIWTDVNTSVDTKNCIWKYFTIFVKIGKMIK